MAVRYAISGREEARAYLEHAVLGKRLRECAGIVRGGGGKTVEEIFGYPDDLKFHSSMTLFAKAQEGAGVFWRGAGEVLWWEDRTRGLWSGLVDVRCGRRPSGRGQLFFRHEPVGGEGLVVDAEGDCGASLPHE